MLVHRSTVVSLGCLGLLAVAGPAVAQVTIYDSGGFEAMRFATTPAPANLAGQDAVLGPWQESHTGSGSTAMVEASVQNGGTQAVQVNRAANDNAHWYVSTPTPAPL